MWKQKKASPPLPASLVALAQWPGGCVAWWPNGPVAQWPGGPVTWWPGGLVAQWLGGSVAWWPWPSGPGSPFSWIEKEMEKLKSWAV